MGQPSPSCIVSCLSFLFTLPFTKGFEAFIIVAQFEFQIALLSPVAFLTVLRTRLDVVAETGPEAVGALLASTFCTRQRW